MPLEGRRGRLGKRRLPLRPLGRNRRRCQARLTRYRGGGRQAESPTSAKSQGPPGGGAHRYCGRRGGWRSRGPESGISGLALTSSQAQRGSGGSTAASPQRLSGAQARFFLSGARLAFASGRPGGVARPGSATARSRARRPDAGLAGGRRAARQAASRAGAGGPRERRSA